MSPRRDVDDYDDYDDMDGGEDQPMMPEAGWADALQSNFGSAPWWVLSALLHAVIVLLMSLFVVTESLPPTSETIIPMEVAEEPPEPEPEKPERDIFEKQDKDVPIETQVENPVVTHEEVEVTDHNETENNMDSQTARGEEDAISDIPCGGKGVVGSMGIGGGGAGAFGFRGGGGRRKAAMRGGGSKGSERAVDAALRWLVKNQESNGRWAIQKWGGRHHADAEVGLTGLCLLAFLGAGHTEKAGKHKDVVLKAIRFLKANQKANGCFGNNGLGGGSEHGQGYNHAIAGLAMAEAYGMAKVKSTGMSAQKGVNYSLNVHQKEYSGWRYGPKEASDLSATGWYVMQLKSAKIAKLKVSGSGFQGAVKFLDSVTEKPDEATGAYGGRCKYMTNNPNHGYDHTMTAVGMLCRQFMGWKKTDPILMGGGDYLKKSLPKWGGNGKWMFYYWYYGTLVMFQMGGDYWKKWNANLREMLIKNQIKSNDPARDGSWEPIKDGGHKAGRAYSTAMCALCLEVYYRYMPLYK